MSGSPQDASRRGFFPSTRWSLISRIKTPVSPADQEIALNGLCAAYWPAVYAYIRYHGESPGDAEDLTQDFLCRIIEKEMLNRATADQGRLRTFLAVALKRFLIDHHRRNAADKRGGGRVHVTINIDTGEEYLSRLGIDNVSPDRFFDRAFAVNLMDQAIKRLRDDYESQQKVHIFDILKPSLLGDSIAGEIAAWAEQLGASQGTVRVAIHRLRKRFRESFRTVVLETVVNPDDLDEELSALLDVAF